MNAHTILEERLDHFTLTGELNFSTVPAIEKESKVLFEKKDRLVIDCSGITTSNSAGVALLLSWVQYAKNHHKAITFRNIPAQLLSITAVAGVESMLPTCT